jgi:HEAT repeat protein
MQKIFFFIAIAFCTLQALSGLENQALAHNPRHVLFFMSSGQVEKAIDLYQKFYQETGQHDFETLEEIGRILLENGCRSRDLETEMISLYGIAISNLSSAENFLENCMNSDNPNVQLVALQLLSQMSSDSVEQILARGMGSPIAIIRFESLIHLATRHSKLALPHIEGLMRAIPKQFDFFKVYFPDLYAELATPEATKGLKLLLTDSNMHVRVSAIHSVAKFHRDDLLPCIRSALSHINPAVLEAAAFTLGTLKDGSCLDRLKELSTSQDSEVALAALVSRINLGEESLCSEIKRLAALGNIYAVLLLANIPDTEELLFSLTKSENSMVRFNALFALLNKRDARATDPLMEFLIHDERDLGLMPIVSSGRCFVAWKLVPSMMQQAKAMQMDLEPVTWQMKNELLCLTLDLPEESFLKVAKAIFDKNQTPLVPTLVRLLENLKTPKAIELLKYNANRPGAPLIRSYCLLGLYRLGVDTQYSAKFLSWIHLQKGSELFRFRPLSMRDVDLKNNTPYHLTPEENSALLLESFDAIARKHETSSIELLLAAIKEGNPKNRPALGGLLLLSLH